MKKILTSALLFLSLTFSAAQTSNAAVGLALTGGWSIYFQIAGGVTIASAIIENNELTIVGVIIGALALDSQTQELQFSQLDKNTLDKVGLTKQEQVAYTQMTEELSEAFTEVTSQLNENSTMEDIDYLLQDHRAILGDHAINAAQKVLKYSISK